MAVLEKLTLPIYVGIVLINLYSLNLQIFLHNAEKPNGEMFVHLKLYHYFYLTNWNFMFQIIFIIIASLDEIVKLLNFPRILKNFFGKTRALLFHALVFPSSFVVIVVFWSLWHIDDTLIMPRSVKIIFPVWLNHALHTSIGVAPILELLLPKRDHFVQPKSTVPIIIFVTCAYNALLYSTYFRNGVWIYPIFRVLNWPAKILFSSLQPFGSILLAKISISIQNLKKPKVLKVK